MRIVAILIAANFSLASSCPLLLAQPRIHATVALPKNAPLEIELSKKGDTELQDGDVVSASYDLMIRNNAASDLLGLVFLEIVDEELHGQRRMYFHYYSTNPQTLPIQAGEERIRPFRYLGSIPTSVGRAASEPRVRGGNDLTLRFELQLYSAVFSDGTSVGVRRPLSEECLKHHEDYLSKLALQIVESEIGSPEYERLMELRSKITGVISKIRHQDWILMEAETRVPR